MLRAHKLRYFVRSAKPRQAFPSRRFSTKHQPINLSLQPEFSAIPKKDHRKLSVVASLKVPSSSTNHIKIHFSALPTQENLERPPIDLVAVLDRSGSMLNSISLVKDTMNFIIQELSDKDRLGIIEYNDKVNTLLPPTKMTSAKKEIATSLVNSMEADGCTNLSGGLFEGVSQVNGISG
jgi:Mg-chelatase subunit ChlD